MKKNEHSSKFLEYSGTKVVHVCMRLGKYIRRFLKYAGIKVGNEMLDLIRHKLVPRKVRTYRYDHYTGTNFRFQ